MGPRGATGEVSQDNFSGQYGKGIQAWGLPGQVGDGRGLKACDRRIQFQNGDRVDGCHAEQSTTTQVGLVEDEMVVTLQP